MPLSSYCIVAIFNFQFLFKSLYFGDKVVVHLARVFGLELTYLQVNGHQTAQFPVKEEHIYTAFLSVVLHCVLVANKSATARCTFSASGLFLFLP